MKIKYFRYKLFKTLTEKLSQERFSYCLTKDLVGWLGFRHIKLCRLFNAKSIFMQIITSISNYSV